MKKVLVTGATGFIGNYVVQALLRAGCEVVATSRHEAKATGSSWYQSVKYQPFDLSAFDDQVDHFSFFGRPDILIHLAWEGLPNYKASFHEEVNLPRHYAFLKNLVVHGLKDVTVTGTCFEYGMQEGELIENMPAKPANAYARAKNTLRLMLEELELQHPFFLKWIRLFYMYGAGQSPNSLIPQLDAALARGDSVFNMSGGEQVRDFLPIEQVAFNIVAIALQGHALGVINCCSGRPEKVKDFVKRYLAHNGKYIELNLGYFPYPDYEPMYFWGNANKMKRVIQHK